MENVPPEIIVAYLISSAFWILLVAAILVGARWSPRLRDLRQRMLAQWRPALVLALVVWVSVILSGRGWLNPTVLVIFCEALLGLALARSIPGFEPLPVAQSVTRGKRAVLVRAAWMIVIALAVVLPALFVGGLGIIIGQEVFHEVNYTREAQSSFDYDAWQMFFVFLWGAGIAEETVYRLVAVSLVWRLTRRAWLGILIGALLFGLYHLSPLSGTYLTFWKFPISQFVSSALIGLVWGFLFVKRGYETAVLAHTLQDWIPVAIFLLAPK